MPDWNFYASQIRLVGFNGGGIDCKKNLIIICNVLKKDKTVNDLFKIWRKFKTRST